MTGRRAFGERTEVDLPCAWPPAEQPLSPGSSRWAWNEEKNQSFIVGGDRAASEEQRGAQLGHVRGGQVQRITNPMPAPRQHAHRPWSKDADIYVYASKVLDGFALHITLLKDAEPLAHPDVSVRGDPRHMWSRFPACYTSPFICVS